MTQETDTSSAPQQCVQCGFHSPEYYCTVAAFKFIKTTGPLGGQRHYLKTQVEVPLCHPCSSALRRMLATQRIIVIFGAALSGMYLTYKAQRYMDPLWSFTFTWDTVLDSLIPFSVAATLSGALLVVLTHWLFQWPWLRCTGIHNWLVNSGRATSGVKITRGPRRRAPN